MFKLLHNNMVTDLVPRLNYVRYLVRAQRWVQTDSQAANGLLGSDGNTIYHLQGTTKTYPEQQLTVVPVEIGEEEYSHLANEFAIRAHENAELRQEVQ